MRNIIAMLLFITSIPYAVKAQDPKAEFLKEPATWSFERFPLPPVFSPNFPFKGIEELRFSPGMFNKDSSDYFSYALLRNLITELQSPSLK